MATDQDFWRAIESAVRELPHQVEWYEGEEIARHLRGEDATATGGNYTTFDAPAHLVDLLGGPDLIRKCIDLARVHGCRLFVGRDNSIRFVRN